MSVRSSVYKESIMHNWFADDAANIDPSCAALLYSFYGYGETSEGRRVKLHNSLLGMGRKARRGFDAAKALRPSDVVVAVKAADAKMQRVNHALIDEAFKRATQPEHAFMATLRYIALLEMVNIIWGMVIEITAALVLMYLGVLAAQIFWAVYMVCAMWATVRFVTSFWAYRAEVKACDSKPAVTDGTIAFWRHLAAEEGEWYC
jgi:hypothetical protein